MAHDFEKKTMMAPPYKVYHSLYHLNLGTWPLLQLKTLFLASLIHDHPRYRYCLVATPWVGYFTPHPAPRRPRPPRAWPPRRQSAARWAEDARHARVPRPR